jgi:hypothetical protein
MSDDSHILYNVPSGCFSSLVGMFLAILACLFLSLMLSGCKAGKVVTEREEVPVVVTQEHHTESVRVDIVRDTIHQRDSIYHYIKGDTTIIERWHYMQGTTKATKVDTLRIYDSVPYPVTVTKETTQIKEVNALRWWQKLFIAIGGVSLIFLLLLMVYKLGKNRV